MAERQKPIPPLKPPRSGMGIVLNVMMIPGVPVRVGARQMQVVRVIPTGLGNLVYFYSLIVDLVP